MKEKTIFLNINFASPETDFTQVKKRKKNKKKEDFIDKDAISENEWQTEYRLIYNSYKLENYPALENADRR